MRERLRHKPHRMLRIFGLTPLGAVSVTKQTKRGLQRRAQVITASRSFATKDREDSNRRFLQSQLKQTAQTSSVSASTASICFLAITLSIRRRQRAVLDSHASARQTKLKGASHTRNALG